MTSRTLTVGAGYGTASTPGNSGMNNPHHKGDKE